MIIHTMEQGSPEWHEIRKGKMTGSHGSEIGNAGAGLTTYIWNIMAQKYASEPTETYVNAHMERGVELEAQARILYELQTQNKVEQVGFIEHDEYIGVSPDGLVGDDGIIEIKCHDNAKHFRLMAEGVKAIESKYIWQIQMNLFVTKRNTATYISYNPNFTKSIVTFIIPRDEEKIKKIEAGLYLGTQMIKNISDKMKTL